MTRTTLVKPADFKRKNYRIDASRYTLGRLATVIARYLQGKHRVEYTPSADTGDSVYVVNALAVKFTGNKLTQKKYHRFSGYPGGLTTTKLQDMMARSPEWVVREAVAGMLPKNKLRKLRLRRLKFVETSTDVKFDADIK